MAKVPKVHGVGEKNILARHRRRLKTMEANRASHGSIWPEITGKRTLDYLERALANGTFTFIQPIKGKKYEIEYKFREHFKTGAILVEATRSELLGNGKLGKAQYSGRYQKIKNGTWVDVTDAFI